jgi:transposase
MLAADAFERSEKNTVIAADLRVSLRSVELWRRSWRRDGRDGLRCSGPAKARKVGEEQFAVLEEELLKGAVFHGWPDERWTLSRIQLLLAHVTGIQLSVRDVWELLRCHGWSCRQPARRAIERNDAGVAGWTKEAWPSAKRPRPIPRRPEHKDPPGLRRRGRPLAILLTPGQRHDGICAQPLLERIRVPRTVLGRPDHVVADRAYSSRGFRAYLRRRGITHTIPQKRD